MKQRKPTKRGRGRPRLPKGEKRDAELRIRLTPTERAALDRAAGGKDTSTWARALLLAEAERA